MAKASSGVNVKELKLEDLIALKAELEQEMGAKRAQVVDEFVAQIRSRAEQIDLPIDELIRLLGRSPARSRGTRKKSSGAATKGTARALFKGPNGESWSGRGRTPVWLRDLEAEGKSRADFKVA